MADNNMRFYSLVRTAPEEALKTITAGRLKGMSDINPMWRIQTLTELFGPCGIGWYYEILDKWLEPYESGEVAAFIEIALYIKDKGEWSKPIIGTGGSKFVASETKGLYLSDECFKMALTDALSVACKALGFGADVYWEAGADSKYSQLAREQIKATVKELSKKAKELFAAGYDREEFYAEVEKICGTKNFAKVNDIEKLTATLAAVNKMEVA